MDKFRRVFSFCTIFTRILMERGFPDTFEKEVNGMFGVAGCLLLAAGVFLLAKWVKDEK